MTFEMNKQSIVQSPKDDILDGIITNIEKTTWRKHLDESALKQFKEETYDNEIVLVYYEVESEDNIFKGVDKFTYYKAPVSNSKLGLFLLKYDDLKVGVKVKVDFNSQGFKSIRLK